MPKRVLPLTDTELRRAKPGSTPFKLFDGGGLYVEIFPSGSKLWRLKYVRPNGRENKLSLGSYPEVSLLAAREKRDTARAQIRDGLDPGELRDEAVRVARAAAEQTFEVVMREWHTTMREQWQPGTAANILHRFECDIFPVVGHLPISAVTSKDILHAVRLIEHRGAAEVARRILADISRVFVFAFHSSYVDRNPALMLNKVLKPQIKGHFAAIDPDGLPALLQALTRNEACMGPIVRIAMRLMLLVFVRTSEALTAQALWRAFQNKRPAPGLIHHSDRGSQYCAHAYQQLVEQFGMRPSMSRRGNCYDTQSKMSLNACRI
jgi:hypothetical protein